MGRIACFLSLSLQVLEINNFNAFTHYLNTVLPLDQNVSDVNLFRDKQWAELLNPVDGESFRAGVILNRGFPILEAEEKRSQQM